MTEAVSLSASLSLVTPLNHMNCSSNNLLRGHFNVFPDTIWYRKWVAYISFKINSPWRPQKSGIQQHRLRTCFVLQYCYGGHIGILTTCVLLLSIHVNTSVHNSEKKKKRQSLSTPYFGATVRDSLHCMRSSIEMSEHKCGGQKYSNHNLIHNVWVVEYFNLLDIFYIIFTNLHSFAWTKIS